MHSRTYSLPRGTFHVKDNEKRHLPALVMIHGWPQSSHCWKDIVPYVEETYRVITPDLRGLGDSERSLDVEDYAKNALAQDMIALLDELEVESFVLVGHDWGGAVAQEMAFAIPDRVKKLVILNINLIHNLEGNTAGQVAHNAKRNFHQWYQFFQQSPPLADTMIPGNEEVWLSYFLRLYKKPFPQEDMAEYIRCYSIPHTATTGANYYRSMPIDIKRWKAMVGQKLPMPTLFIHGNKDFVVTEDYLKGVETCFDSIEIESIVAGHFVMEDAPEEVGGAIRSFLNR